MNNLKHINELFATPEPEVAKELKFPAMHRSYVPFKDAWLKYALTTSKLGGLHVKVQLKQNFTGDTRDEGKVFVVRNRPYDKDWPDNQLPHYVWVSRIVRPQSSGEFNKHSREYNLGKVGFKMATSDLLVDTYTIEERDHVAELFGNIMSFEEYAMYEYSEEQETKYLTQKEQTLPAEVKVKDIHKIIDELNQQLGKSVFKFFYTIPYKDTRDEKHGNKYKAIEHKWWASITICKKDEEEGEDETDNVVHADPHAEGRHEHDNLSHAGWSEVGSIKLCKEPNEEWRFFGTRMRHGLLAQTIEKKINSFFKSY